MKRVGIIVALLMATLWQSLAFAGAASTSNALANLEHTVLHWDEEGHHHHDDGSYHLDDSEESVLHVMADHVSVSATMPSSALPLPQLAAGAPRVHEARAGPHPFLDGLLKPPRLTA